MSDGLTLEKMKVSERLKTLEESNGVLNESLQEIKVVLFGEKGEKGVVSKLTDMVDIANKIESVLSWIAKLIFGALVLASLPSLASFINTITHAK